ncbi:MAG: hypothetical protein D6731_03200 [Planctomycetota bacterium]|nr:MAG: hypothetical protein D6731_03200 [Planctomycetota bacterium]
MLWPLLFTAVFPPLVAAAALALAGILGGRRPERGAAWGGAALALAYLVGHPGVRGQLVDALPPTDVTDWPWALAPLAALLGGVLHRWGRVAPLRWVLLCSAQGLGLWLVLAPALRNQGSSGAWLVVFLAGLLALAYALGLAGLEEPEREPSALLGLVALVSFSSGVVVLGRTASVGQLCGVLAAGLFGLFVVRWRGWAQGLLRSTAPVLALLHPLLVANAYAYAYLPASATILLALGPLLLAAARRGPFRGRPTWQALALGLAASGAAYAGAAALAAGAAPEPYSPY